MTKTNEALIDSFLSYNEVAEVSNEKLLLSTLKIFKDKIVTRDFIIDKSGVKTVELLGWQCKSLNPWQPILNFNGKSTSLSYCKEELLWYLSQSLSVKDISKKAKIWQQICSSKSEVNSNYGWCIFSKDNYSQFDNVLSELIEHSDSRRAVMIYTRPSMWFDYNRDGMSDFICTWGTHCFIRHNKLYYIINQRSCDFWFGLRNDFVFHCFIYQMLFNALRDCGIQLEHATDTIIYNCDTIHLYERHFDLCKSIC